MPLDRSDHPARLHARIDACISYTDGVTPPNSTLPWERLTERSPLAARIAAHTAQAIIERRHREGELITESELADANGASRTPAREAMVQLETWGLVRLAPKKGAIVTAVTPEERRDLLAVRTLFEANVRPDAATADALAEALAANLERQESALTRSDLLDFAGADHGFHSLLIQSSGNSVTMEILDRLGPRLARLTYQVIAEHPERIAVFLSEHRVLARHLADADREHYAELVRAHISAGHADAVTVAP